MQTAQVQMPLHSRRVYTHMGLSWFIDPDETSPKLNHDGGTSQLAFMHILPRQRVAYALLINSMSMTIGEAVRRAIFTEIAGLPAEAKPVPPPAIAFDPERYTGVYVGLDQTHTVTRAKSGHLRVEIQNKGQGKPTKLTLRAVAPDEFAILDKPQVDQGIRMVFLGEQDGLAEYCRLGVRMRRRAEQPGRRKRGAPVSRRLARGKRS